MGNPLPEEDENRLVEEALRVVLKKNISETTINSFVVVELDGKRFAVGYDPETPDDIVFGAQEELADMEIGDMLVIHKQPFH